MGSFFVSGPYIGGGSVTQSQNIRATQPTQVTATQNAYVGGASINGTQTTPSQTSVQQLANQVGGPANISQSNSIQAPSLLGSGASYGTPPPNAFVSDGRIRIGVPFDAEPRTPRTPAVPRSSVNTGREPRTRAPRGSKRFDEELNAYRAGGAPSAGVQYSLSKGTTSPNMARSSSGGGSTITGYRPVSSNGVLEARYETYKSHGGRYDFDTWKAKYWDTGLHTAAGIEQQYAPVYGRPASTTTAPNATLGQAHPVQPRSDPTSGLFVGAPAAVNVSSGSNRATQGGFISSPTQYAAVRQSDPVFRTATNVQASSPTARVSPTGQVSYASQNNFAGSPSQADMFLSEQLLRGILGPTTAQAPGRAFYNPGYGEGVEEPPGRAFGGPGGSPAEVQAHAIGFGPTNNMTAVGGLPLYGLAPEYARFAGSGGAVQQNATVAKMLANASREYGETIFINGPGDDGARRSGGVVGGEHYRGNAFDLSIPYYSARMRPSSGPNDPGDAEFQRLRRTLEDQGLQMLGYGRGPNGEQTWEWWHYSPNGR